MRPFIFSIGSTQIPSFFFFIMIATLACTFYLYWLAKKQNLKPDVMLDLGMIGMISGVLGARIFHILVEAPDYYWEKPMRVFEFWRGGFVSWGGFLALALSLSAYFKIRKIPVLIYLDAFAAGAPLIKFFVRVGCLLAGCCYGYPTNVPWAIHFDDPASTAHYYFGNTPLHPVQVYSMIHASLLFGVVNWVYWKTRKKGKPATPGAFKGQIICLLAIGWSLPRMVIEHFRGDADRGVYFGGLVSTGQITGGVITLAAILLYFYFRKKYGRAASHAE